MEAGQGASPHCALSRGGGPGVPLAIPPALLVGSRLAALGRFAAPGAFAAAVPPVGVFRGSSVGVVSSVAAAASLSLLRSARWVMNEAGVGFLWAQASVPPVGSLISPALRAARASANSLGCPLLSKSARMFASDVMRVALWRMFSRAATRNRWRNRRMCMGFLAPILFTLASTIVLSCWCHSRWRCRNRGPHVSTAHHMAYCSLYSMRQRPGRPCRVGCRSGLW